jgi:chlorobactene glucosyltransferase
MILLIILVSLVSLGSLSILKTSLRKRVLDLDPVEAREVLPESVSVIVPMRDEEENVDRCLTGLRAQFCSQVETIVVDDCSTDRTAERLAFWKKSWPELKIVRLDANEQRWAGKTYALHRGIEVSTGASLLFIDADVALEPGAIARIVTTACDRRWPVVSVVGKPESSALWESAIVGCLMAWFVYFRIMRPESLLLGAFIYIKRSLYDSIGGYGNVRKAIVKAK